MNSDRLRVAVVGTGEWWGREHARVFSQRPDVELCAIVGRSSDKTMQRAAEFGTDALRRPRRDARDGDPRSRLAVPAQRGSLRHDVAG